MRKQSDAFTGYTFCHFSVLSCSFKVLYGHLKDMKTEIEHIQHLLEKAKVQLQKDFDVWWKQQANQVRLTVSSIPKMRETSL